jgi:hypothetical protein
MKQKGAVLKYLNILVSAGLLTVSAIMTVQMINLARQNQEMKIDLAELNHIQYGLLNADEWKEQITLILGRKIVEFDLSPENRGELQHSIERIMYGLLDDLEVIIQERTSGQFSGMKRFIASMVLDVNQLRDSVPSYAGKVLDELENPATKRELQIYLSDKLGALSETTFNLDSMSGLYEVLQKYGSGSKEECRAILEPAIERKAAAIDEKVMMILLCVLLVFLVNTIPRGGMNPFQAPLLILSSLCLLLGGIITPMIDLEARIDMLQFQLIGELVEFRDNIIYFQSKSITDIVEILVREGSLEMIFVGVLIFCFSIVFPVLKLASSYVYSLNLGKVNENPVIRFFVIKSGKWSMADVMVVAIFMAYIGFDGIVGSQLDSLSESTEAVDIFTTNGTQLLGGFYLFLGFVVSSLVLSEILTRKLRPGRKPEHAHTAA